MGEATAEKDSDFAELIRSRIENLRPKLLDLSRRNPLISTRLSPRSNSIVRVVDELPAEILSQLSGERSMCLVALPALADDPKDEQAREFQAALSSGRLADEVYLSAMKELDADDDESAEKGRRIERDLRDRIRVALGMATRQRKGDVTLAQHARNNGFNPSFELPSAATKIKNERHLDQDIQTLLLPEDLDRKLNSLSAKCRTWVQETGINVLHGAFGFLEWTDPASNSTVLSPLVLLPVEMEKEKTRDGAQYWVKAAGDEPETNLVLVEKMRLGFSIDLPKFQGGSLEQYFDDIAKSAPKTLQWKVRRQVAFGVFPSSRMAMYQDLDPSRTLFEQNENVSRVFGGSNAGGATPYADEHEIDQPNIESKVPYLVMDADSSQFSTIVDIANGKSTAVEGPPGTGKSQTIVNTIAAAIASGKKVLFVAEKLAALEVVRNRLAAVGLGEFVLPLQAERSARESVISSVRERVEIKRGPIAQDYEARIKKYRELRADLAAYIDAISSAFGVTGFTVYEILGRCVATNSVLASAPRELQSPRIADVERFDRLELETTRSLADAVTAAWKSAQGAQAHWAGLKHSSINKFAAEELGALAAATAQAFAQLDQARSALERIGGGEERSPERLRRVLGVSEALAVLAVRSSPELVTRVCAASQTQAFLSFLERCAEHRNLHERALRYLRNPHQADNGDRIREVIEACSSGGIASLDPRSFDATLAALQQSLDQKKALIESLEPLIDAVPEMATIPISIIERASVLVQGEFRDILALRSVANADAAASPLIRSLALTGAGLLNQRNDLEKALAVESELTVSEIRNHSATLKDGTFFRRLGGAYRAAKSVYRSLSKEAHFDREQAGQLLQRLAEWKHAESVFKADPQASVLYGVHFRGVETEFEKFNRLLSYYEAVEEAIPDAKYRQVRRFLKSAEIDLLETLPRGLGGAYGGSYAELTAVVARLEAELSTARSSFARLEALVGIFVDPAAVSLSKLSQAVLEVEELVRLRESLDCDIAMKAVFGDLFTGSNTMPEKFDADRQILEIISKENEDAQVFIKLLESRLLSEFSTAIRETLGADKQANEHLSALTNASHVPFNQRLARVAASDVAKYLREAALDIEGIFTHAAYSSAYSELHARNMSWAVDALLRNAGNLENLSDILEASIFRGMAMRVYEKHGKALSRYKGDTLTRKRKELADCDRELLKLSRQHLRSKLIKEARPPRGNGVGRRSTWTDMALIENEIAKKQAYVSVRDLTRRAGSALMELKPIWMMSPLAVAQYLPAGTVGFDLCIIDEASQMPPEDAVGALVRSKQAMVVGDTNQLPPTNFFRLMVDDEDLDEDEAVLDESILEMANSAFRPVRRLRWHYRSRHSGLISFSNQHVYDNNLIVFPSAHESAPDMGVSLVQVQGRYHGGLNEDEATAMVEAILQFMREQPDRSLGVVTLNQKQRDLILEELDTALARDVAAADYVEDWATRNDGLETFFVKNLENVQGDERDVIFIGTVYGPETVGGPVMQRFGPINGLAGKRRLNVLFSRAKEQIVTFSSMTSADIRAEEQGNPGVFMLKRWLEYSATGVIHAGESSGKEPDSDFESHVMEHIRAMGCTAIPQVGVAGYFIDIGIKHPSWPHGYIMGVECDGATYHSSRSARDRDRLREEVLNRLGWKLHRIWSTDWFNDARFQTSRLRTVIENRLSELKQTVASSPGKLTLVAGSSNKT